MHRFFTRKGVTWVLLLIHMVFFTAGWAKEGRPTLPNTEMVACQPVTINEAPRGRLEDEYYFYQITQNEGRLQNWSVSTPALLPPGMTLVNGGYYAFIQGQPTQAGTYTFILRGWVDSPECTSEDTLTIIIDPAPACQPITINEPPRGRVNEPYGYQVAEYEVGRKQQWYVSTFELLPPGLGGMENDGYSAFLQGVPTQAGTYTFIIKGWVDARNCAREDTLTIIIDPALIGTSTVRINAGGASFTTQVGVVFGADAYYEGDTKTTPFQYYGIANTLDDTLYRTDRVGNVDKKTFRYQIPVNNGEYQVRLHFSENYFREAGRRVFSVAAEGEAKLVNYDIYASVGRKYAVIKTYPVTVTDGNLTLDFSATVNRAKINAIEVLPATTTLAREQTEVVDIREASPVLQASPNPFSEQTTLNFQLDQTQGAILQLYTLQGQLVRTLFAGEVEAGILQQIALDGTNLPAGVYLVRLVTDEQVSHLKVVLNQ